MELVSLAHLLVTKSVAISGLLMTLTRMNVNWNVKVNLKLMQRYIYMSILTILPLLLFVLFTTGQLQDLWSPDFQ